LRLFNGLSVTADGRYVAGIYEVEHGENVAKSVVFLVDTTGTVRFPVDDAPYSFRLHCSRTGNWIALETLRGGLEVGALEIDR
jgi:hypothetical protein